MPKFYFEEVKYTTPRYEVKAKNLEEATAIYEKQRVGKMALVDNKTVVNFLFEVKDEHGRVVWSDEPENKVVVADDDDDQIIGQEVEAFKDESMNANVEQVKQQTGQDP